MALVRADFGGGASIRRSQLAGSGPDPQGGRVLPRHRRHEGGVEGSGSDY